MNKHLKQMNQYNTDNIKSIVFNTDENAKPDTAFEEWKKIKDAHKVLDEEDMVNNPSHYQSMTANLNIDCITAMQAAFGMYETAVFCKLNAFKYIWRATSKGGNQDIDKALWYLEKYRKLGGEDQ